ncbi:hypothetical protein S144_73 [Shewanella sp. phage 1/44]|uniref:hypothetical protein n=1 Tax=Shewanella sp. phage 1/44 TaxID=1458862 RepID=UPI0004F8F03F|nr:hypothetical protein S144_73 [Shewanella sp. phage 1/44]AHK11787.1 hypothetical protein S144_73 [Shewanella sp. phage 1/44]
MKITDIYGHEHQLEITATHTCIAINSAVQTYVAGLNEINKLLNELFEQVPCPVAAETMYKRIINNLQHQLSNGPNVDNYAIDVTPGMSYSAASVTELLNKSVRRINKQNRQYEKLHEEHRALGVKFSNHCHDVDSKNESLNELLIKYNKPKPSHLNMHGHLTYLFHDLLGVKPARPVPGNVYINGHNVESKYADGLNGNMLVVLCDDIRPPAPYVPMTAPAPVPPTPEPKPITVVMQPSSNGFSYQDLVKVGWDDQQLVEAGYAKWLSDPVHSNLMYPPVDAVRKSITSVTINNQQCFDALDMLELSHAWEQFHANEFNTVKQLVKYDSDDGVDFNNYLKSWCNYQNRVRDNVDHVFKDLDTPAHANYNTIDKLRIIDQTIELALVNNTKVSNVINKIHCEIGLPVSVNDVDIFEKLAAIDFHINKLESTVTANMTKPQGVYIQGDLCVVSSLSDQWCQVYNLVNDSAGGDVETAMYAAQSFIDSLKQ